MSNPERTPRPTLGAVFANWRDSDASFLTKLRQAASNNWTKLSKRQNCCGNDGQPGC